MRIHCNNIVTECSIFAETKNKYERLIYILSYCVCLVFYVIEIYGCMGDIVDEKDGQSYSNTYIFQDPSRTRRGNR